MYLLYLDDSGSTGNPYEEYLVLAGVSIFERQIHYVSSQLDAIAEKLHPDDPGVVEFHASAIFSGKVPPWKGMTKSKRREIIKEILGVLAKTHESTHAFACAVHTASFPSEDPMELAFEDLCSRFDLQLARLYHSGKQNNGLIILDESSYETSLQNLALQFNKEGTMWRQLKNITEVPLFTDSRASRLVQLADHIAYAVFRFYERDDNSYLKIILPRFDSQEGKMHGMVHKQTHLSKCMCPACMSRR